MISLKKNLLRLKNNLSKLLFLLLLLFIMTGLFAVSYLAVAILIFGIILIISNEFFRTKDVDLFSKTTLEYIQTLIVNNIQRLALVESVNIIKRLISKKTTLFYLGLMLGIIILINPNNTIFRISNHISVSGNIDSTKKDYYQEYSKYFSGYLSAEQKEYILLADPKLAHAELYKSETIKILKSLDILAIPGHRKNISITLKEESLVLENNKQIDKRYIEAIKFFKESTKNIEDNEKKMKQEILLYMIARRYREYLISYNNDDKEYSQLIIYFNEKIRDPQSIQVWELNTILEDVKKQEEEERTLNYTRAIEFLNQYTSTKEFTTYEIDIPIINNYELSIEPLTNNQFLMSNNFQTLEKISLNEFDIYLPKLLTLLNNKDMYSSNAIQSSVSNIEQDIKVGLNNYATRQRQDKVNSKNRGFILREINIKPLKVDTNGYLNISINKNYLKTKLCINSCPTSNIKLLNFPLGSFYRAKNANLIERNPYLTTETIKWSIDDIDHGIQIAYIIPPFNHLRNLIEPFVMFFLVNKWFMLILGLSIVYYLKGNLVKIINTNEVISMSSSKSQGNINQQGSFGIGVNQGEISENAKIVGVYNESQRQELAETAKEIEALLNQLNQTYPSETKKEKRIFAAEAMDIIEQNPSLMQKLFSAAKAGSLAALESMLNHPAASFIIGALEELDESQKE